MTETLRIIHYPDPRLRKRSAPVTLFNDDLERLATRMLELMREAKGVGLAAAQVGINQRLFVMNPDGAEGNDRVVVNPTLLDPHDEDEAEEGCLSLPDVHIDVLRAKTLTLRAQDIEGKPIEITETGYVARIWQHEFDHLDGILLLDKLSATQKLQHRKAVREMEEAFAKAARK